jgi:hypothetical protein
MSLFNGDRGTRHTATRDVPRAVVRFILWTGLASIAIVVWHWLAG